MSEQIIFDKATIINTPYAVLNTYDNFKNNLNIDIDFDKTLNNLKLILKNLYEKERKKEMVYVQYQINELKKCGEIGLEMGEKFEELLTYNGNPNGEKLNLVFNLLKQAEYGLREDIGYTEEQIKVARDQWQEFRNNTVIDTIRDSFLENVDRALPINELFEGDYLNSNFSDLLNNAEKSLNKKITNKKKIDDIQKEYLKDAATETFKNLRITARERYGKKWQDKTIKDFLSSYSPAKNLLSPKKTKSSDYRTIGEAVSSLLYSFNLSGLFGEAATGSRSGFRLNTGSTKTTYRSFLGGKSLVASQQTDVIEIANFSFRYDTTQMNSKKDANIDNYIDYLRTINGSLYKLQKRIETFNDSFVVHYSSKDYANQYYDKSTNSIKVSDFTIRQTSSLEYRLQSLKEIANIVNSRDIKDLIFGIVNAGEGLVASDNIQQITDGISALVGAWVFEDYGNTFSQLKTETSNNHLHCFFLSGGYLLFSEMLLQIYNRLNQDNEKDVVKIHFQPYSGISAYQQVQSNESLHGIDRWNKMRDIVIRKGRLGISISQELLNILLYNE